MKNVNDQTYSEYETSFRPKDSTGEIQQIFEDHAQFMIIGLTGRTGAGCSTMAAILKKEFEDIAVPEFNSDDFPDDEARKLALTVLYAKNHWVPFVHIKMSDVITSFILSEAVDKLVQFIDKNIAKGLELQPYWGAFAEKFEIAYNMGHEISKSLQPDEGLPNIIPAKKLIDPRTYEYYFKRVPAVTAELKNALNAIEPSFYTTLYQAVGSNIRSSGRPYEEDYDPANISTLAEATNKLIKILRMRHRCYPEKKKSEVRVVIDALRNPYEIHYFRQRYSAYYTMAISVEDHDRKTRLHQSELTDDNIVGLDDKESPNKPPGFKAFVGQNIRKCVEIADIHIHNPNDDTRALNDLKSKAIRYVALMLHPGLITPSLQERCMQLAFQSRFNSGCLSRQVGALITDSAYSVKSIGWNSPPQGQTPCILRCASNQMRKTDVNAYSQFELSNRPFSEVITAVFGDAVENAEKVGKRVPYCFKDVYNALKGGKNQVYVRALHAEENAMLQIAKYGGEGLTNGFLFTTASPCELCAKKAYQIGIKKIFYIDPYPGIADEHILTGWRNDPELILFEGAIGRAYEQLFQPLMPFKDELDIELDINKRLGEYKPRSGTVVQASGGGHNALGHVPHTEAQKTSSFGEKIPSVPLGDRGNAIRGLFWTNLVRVCHRLRR